LLKRPDSVWQAFCQGVLAGFLALGIELAIGVAGIVLRASGRAQAIVAKTMVLGAVALFPAITAGLLWAAWRLLQLWGYDRFTNRRL
jgi:hypothetical protein